VFKGARFGQKGAVESGINQFYILASSITCLKSSGERQKIPMNSSSDYDTSSSSSTTPLTQQAISQTSRNNQSSSATEGFLLGNDLSSSFSSSSSSSVSSRNLQFSKQELQLVRSLALSEYCLPILVQNFCPTIFGHELVKVGFLLGLFGGSSGNGDEYDNESKSFKVRNNIHFVLVVGDPGLGKVSFF
jgi:DNA replicative helicase MCM subunit Mcm2 (Cdc46/Mcm family)